MPISYEYADKTEHEELYSLHQSIEADPQISTHLGTDYDLLYCQWDEEYEGAGVGAITVVFSANLCNSCESALDAIVADF